MTSAAPKSPLGSEFDKFLFALIGEDLNGLPLSVVSHLARMNLDPWQEAGNLAALPADVAATRLARSLDTLTDPVLRQANSATLVRRLLDLLPRHIPVVAPTLIVGAVIASHPGSRIAAIAFITCVILFLGSQFLTAHRSTPTQPGAVNESVVPVAPSQTLPENAYH